MGPFSLRQLLILGAGFGLSYTLFAVTSRFYELNVVEYIIIAIPGLFALAAALIKIYHVTFIKFLLLSLEHAINPKKRHWDHQAIAPTVDPDLTEKTKSKKGILEVEKKKTNVNLRALSVTLDSGGFTHLEGVEHEDLDKVNDDDLITQAYFGHRRNEGPVHNMYWRTRDVQKKKLDILAKLPTVIPTNGPTSQTMESNPSSQAKGEAEIPTTEVNNNLKVVSNLKKANFKILNEKSEVILESFSALQMVENGIYAFLFALPSGNYRLQFEAVQGYLTPKEMEVTLTSDLKTLMATYEKIKTSATEKPQENQIQKPDVKPISETSGPTTLIPEIPSSTPSTSITPPPISDASDTPPKKKKRRRKKKKKLNQENMSSSEVFSQKGEIEPKSQIKSSMVDQSTFKPEASSLPTSNKSEDFKPTLPKNEVKPTSMAQKKSSQTQIQPKLNSSMPLTKKSNSTPPPTPSDDKNSVLKEGEEIEFNF